MGWKLTSAPRASHQEAL